MKHRIAALLALAMLTACPITPTVSSVTFVGPSSLVLKIGATVTLTATAKDASGTVLAGKTFTWVSSDPSVMSVDAQGIVTAKRLGNAKITATTDGKSGEANLKTYGLEVVGGTYALPDGSFGTAVSWRVRGADGNPPPADTGLTVTGPSGWRTGRPPFIVKYDDGGTWGIRWTGAYTSAPVSGTYQASITVGGEVLSTAFQIDASKKVGIVSGVKLSNITTTGFDVSWTLPSDGYGFEVDLVEDPDGAAKLLLEQKATGSTARIAGLTLNPAKTYQIQVFAAGTDVSATNAALPAQLDLSISYQSFTVPAASVTVTSPAGNTLKLGEPSALSAVAKDAGGNVLNGKSLTWASSDPSVATVDASGNVTAKRFGTVTISASVDGVTGASASLTTYGLEVVGGTRDFGDTTFLLRFRNPDGSNANANVDVSVTGPAGWNGGTAYVRPDVFFGDKTFTWFEPGFYGPGIVPVSGTYQFTGTISGKVYTASTIIDATSKLLSPASLTVNAASAASVSGTWAAVSGAQIYELVVWNDTDKRTEGMTQYLMGLNGTKSGLSLVNTKTNYLQVSAFSLDPMTTLNTPFVGQFNVSFTRTPFTF